DFTIARRSDARRSVGERRAADDRRAFRRSRGGAADRRALFAPGGKTAQWRYAGGGKRPQRMMSARRLPRAVSRGLAALLGIFVALAISELAVRSYLGEPLLPLVPPEPYVDNAVLYRRNPSRLYDLRPGVDQTVRRERIRIHVNAAAMRDDREFPRPKPAGVVRVVVLG